MHTHLPAYPRRIYARASRQQISDSEDSCLLIRRVRLVCDSCSSGPRFAIGFLQTPPHSGRPCRSADTSLCRACRGLPPPSGCALPGAHKKRAIHSRNGPLLRGCRIATAENPSPRDQEAPTTRMRCRRKRRMLFIHPMPRRCRRRPSIRVVGRRALLAERHTPF